ncbi:hypothetical protein PR048_031686 [Dryococelus australis]|uniref:Uncharacterized protein n=1 Tax=Dryococelus australis TaxID=614101 RepID=A0ABQ9G8M0_9NEOP|nr:hypothetical protein PR048_031686 [Dryococelus australis]
MKNNESYPQKLSGMRVDSAQTSHSLNGCMKLWEWAVCLIGYYRLPEVRYWLDCRLATLAAWCGGGASQVVESPSCLRRRNMCVAAGECRRGNDLAEWATVQAQAVLILAPVVCSACLKSSLVKSAVGHRRGTYGCRGPSRWNHRRAVHFRYPGSWSPSADVYQLSSNGEELRTFDDQLKCSGGQYLVCCGLRGSSFEFRLSQCLYPTMNELRSHPSLEQNPRTALPLTTDCTSPGGAQRTRPLRAGTTEFSDLQAKLYNLMCAYADVNCVLILVVWSHFVDAALCLLAPARPHYAEQQHTVALATDRPARCNQAGSRDRTSESTWEKVNLRHGQVIRVVRWASARLGRLRRRAAKEDVFLPPPPPNSRRPHDSLRTRSAASSLSHRSLPCATASSLGTPEFREKILRPVVFHNTLAQIHFRDWAVPVQRVFRCLPANLKRTVLKLPNPDWPVKLIPGAVAPGIFVRENRSGRFRWSAGFLGDLPFPPPLLNLHLASPLRLSDIDFKGRPSLFSRSVAWTPHSHKASTCSLFVVEYIQVQSNWIAAWLKARSTMWCRHELSSANPGKSKRDTAHLLGLGTNIYTRKGGSGRLTRRREYRRGVWKVPECTRLNSLPVVATRQRSAATGAARASLQYSSALGNVQTCATPRGKQKGGGGARKTKYLFLAQNHYQWHLPAYNATALCCDWFIPLITNHKTYSLLSVATELFLCQMKDSTHQKFYLSQKPNCTSSWNERGNWSTSRKPTGQQGKSRPVLHRRNPGIFPAGIDLCSPAWERVKIIIRAVHGKMSIFGSSAQELLTCPAHFTVNSIYHCGSLLDGNSTGNVVAQIPAQRLSYAVLFYTPVNGNDMKTCS